MSTNVHRRYLRIGLPLLVFAAISAGVFVWALAITPDYYGTSLFGQSQKHALPLKSWLATGLVVLALLQLFTALWIYRKLPLPQPPHRLSRFHRVLGLAAILVSLPIAYHCLFAYGFGTFNSRVLVHSLAGCFFYGAIAAKITVVRSKGLASWALPLAGGTLFSLVVLLWYTSALWYFNGQTLPP